MVEIAIITARGNSVGLPGKNIRPLGGLPLIEWTIRAALHSGVFERVIVSTDALEIAAVAESAGAEIPFIRPAELATSEARSIDVIEHALSALKVRNSFALLQPTSPFRNAEIISSAEQKFCEMANSSVFSVAAGKPLAWTYQISEEGYMKPIDPDAKNLYRRQDSSSTFFPNGALYFCKVKSFLKKKSLFHTDSAGLVMGQIDSLDIDTSEDFELAESVVTANLRYADPRLQKKS